MIQKIYNKAKICGLPKSEQPLDASKEIQKILTLCHLVVIWTLVA